MGTLAIICILLMAVGVIAGIIITVVGIAENDAGIAIIGFILIITFTFSVWTHWQAYHHKCLTEPVPKQLGNYK